VVGILCKNLIFRFLIAFSCQYTYIRAYSQRVIEGYNVTQYAQFEFETHAVEYVQHCTRSRQYTAKNECQFYRSKIVATRDEWRLIRGLNIFISSHRHCSIRWQYAVYTLQGCTLLRRVTHKLGKPSCTIVVNNSRPLATELLPPTQ